MSGRIIISQTKEAHPLDVFTVFGHVRISDNLTININQISSVELHSSDAIRVRGGGYEYEFVGDDAKNFLTKFNELAAAILQQMSQPQIATVPPGTRLRQ